MAKLATLISDMPYMFMVITILMFLPLFKLDIYIFLSIGFPHCENTMLHEIAGW